MKLFNFRTLLAFCAIALVLNACNDYAPATSKKIQTNNASDITSESAVLNGSIHFDIADYNKIEFGFIVSTDLQDVNSHENYFISCNKMEGKNFYLELDRLEPNTQYYYCSWLILNGVQYEYGAVKSFVTQREYNPIYSSDYPANTNFTSKEFSVSNSKKIVFSPGNLQYSTVDNVWRFAQQQYKTIAANSDGSNNEKSGWMDLFAWGTGDKPLMNDSLYSSTQFVDWGKNTIDGSKKNTWRTLAIDEWVYLLYGRTNAEKLMGTATINAGEEGDYTGLILLPDNWDFENGLEFNPDLIGWKHNVLSMVEWSMFELLGAVFLPARGYQREQTIMLWQESGRYWSSTSIEANMAYGIRISRSKIIWDEETYRNYGFSVRLVKDK